MSEENNNLNGLPENNLENQYPQQQPITEQPEVPVMESPVVPEVTPVVEPIIEQPVEPQVIVAPEVPVMETPVVPEVTPVVEPIMEQSVEPQVIAAPEVPVMETPVVPEVTPVVEPIIEQPVEPQVVAAPEVPVMETSVVPEVTPVVEPIMEQPVEPQVVAAPEVPVMESPVVPEVTPVVGSIMEQPVEPQVVAAPEVPVMEAPVVPEVTPVVGSIMEQPAQPMENTQVGFNNSQMSQPQMYQTNQSPMNNNLLEQNVNLNQNLANTPFMNETIDSGPVTVEKKKKKFAMNSKIISLIIVVMLLAAGAFCYLYFVTNSPENIYKSLVKNAVTSIYETAYQNENKINNTVKMDFEVNLKENIDQKLLDLINKSTIAVNYQLNRTTNEMVLKLNADYEQDNLLDLQLFLDANKEKTYLYAPEYIDKYLEVEVDSYVDIKESLKNGLSVPKNYNETRNILIDEFTSLISKENCRKENGVYIFEVTEKELGVRLKNIINNLANNITFLSNFENTKELQENLQEFAESIDEQYLTDEKITFYVNKKIISTNIDELKAVVDKEEIKLNIVDNKVNYSYMSDSKNIFSGYVITNSNGDTSKTEFSIDVPEVGNIKIFTENINKNGTDVDKIDTTKIKKIDALTEVEQQNIDEKLENSKLYEVFSGLFSSMSPTMPMNDTLYDDSYYNSYDDSDFYSDNDETGITNTIRTY